MKHRLIAICITTVFWGAGCEKILNRKPDKKLVVPRSISDLQAILDNNSLINSLRTGVGEASADNYYLDVDAWSSRSEQERNTYIWETDNAGDAVYENLYRRIYPANVVLDIIERQYGENLSEVEKDVRGQALFIRANGFFSLAVGWAKQYLPETADSEMGIPIRLSPDFNTESKRTSLKDTYRQIESDLLEAVGCLPMLSNHAMRPSKWAGYALLSRLYLAMKQYEKAERYADSCLNIRNTLIDYNDLNIGAPFPIAAFNEEVIYHLNGTIGIVAASFTKVADDLYSTYDERDLRRQIFYADNADGSKRFKGSYFGSVQLFTGLATDEVYLNKSECLVRRGENELGIEFLTSLLIKRYAHRDSIPVIPSTDEELLQFVLSERRKELAFRDVRWMDLKRLNTEENTAVTLRRKLGEKEYILLPNDNRYALPFPQSVVDIAGITQNPR